MRRRFDFIDLPKSSFVVVALLSCPRCSSQIIGIVEGEVVIAPISGVFNVTRPGYCGFEATGLGDKPVRHISAITVASNRKLFGIRDAFGHECVNPFQYVFAWPGDDLRNNCADKAIAVTAGSTIIRTEN